MKNKINKRIFLFAIMLGLFIGLSNLNLSASAEIRNGVCGNDLTWTLDTNTGLLEISGTGDMYEYLGNSAPWYEYSNNVKTIIISDGVTSIGSSAFWEFGNLTSIIIPDSVTSIGHTAFLFCRSLTSVAIPDGIASIEHSMFFHCYGLTDIDIPVSVRSIGSQAFEYCLNLTSVIIPANVTHIGSRAFWNNYNLESVIFEGNAPNSVEDDAFDGVSGVFVIYYYMGATGFTTPMWNGYPTIEISSLSPRPPTEDQPLPVNPKTSDSSFEIICFILMLIIAIACIIHATTQHSAPKAKRSVEF
jgi:hypothetical protein